MCENIWLYHIVDIPTVSSRNFNIFLNVKKYSGDFDMFARKGVVPVKRVPPFLNMHKARLDGNVSMCGVEPGERVYVGMLGGSECASYEVVVTMEEDTLGSGRKGCNDELTQADLLPEEAKLGSKLVPDTLQLGHCTPYAWSDWYIPVSMEDQLDNLIFELVDNAEGEGDNPEAVSVHLFRNGIPQDRRTETRIDRSKVCACTVL